MRKNSFKRRRFKRTSDRKLSGSDLRVLDFLWTWKVATTPMLKIAAYQNQSDWWIYKTLQQLKTEKYIQALPRGKFLEQELWALTELGFEVVLMDRDDITHYRYKPHAPTHDFLATCLQLGDLWISSVERRFFTEQMLSSLSRSNFPSLITENTDHIPDGVTLLSYGSREAIVGYEVDLNLKEESRYKNTFYYWQSVTPHLVVWLVRNQWMAQRISKLLSLEWSEDKFIDSKVAFIMLDDFKECVWEAKVVGGKLNGLSIRKLHENLVQSLTKESANLAQKPMSPVFFPKYKSPQKLNVYVKGEKLDSN